MVGGNELRRSSAKRRNDILAAKEEERLIKPKIANLAYPKTITFAKNPENNDDMSVITTASSFHSDNDSNYDDDAYYLLNVFTIMSQLLLMTAMIMVIKVKFPVADYTDIVSTLKDATTLFDKYKCERRMNQRLMLMFTLQTLIMMGCVVMVKHGVHPLDTKTMNARKSILQDAKTFFENYKEMRIVNQCS